VLADGRPRRHCRDRPILLVADHPAEVGPEQKADLARDRAEQLAGRDVLSNKRRHPPQRRLLLREQAQLVATCLERALRLAQLGLDAPALGCVPSDAVHGAPLGHRPRVPLEPPHRAVCADDAGLEADQIVTLRELASASRVGSTSSGWRKSKADREKSSCFGYPNRRRNDAFTRLNSPSKPMIDSGSVERSKNSSSSVSGCGTCGGLATSTRSFRSRDYPYDKRPTCRTGRY
jgi:hypothetical protein